jgi:hypothetical protein
MQIGLKAITSVLCIVAAIIGGGSQTPEHPLMANTRSQAMSASPPLSGA